MEMTAVLRALAHLGRTPGQVAVFTDSTYVIRGITQWIFGWRKRGWKKADGSEVTNQDLWQKLFQVTYARKPKVIWRYVPGHAGVPGNERCDEIAVAFSKGRRIRLHRGSESDYGVDLTVLPPAAPLPEMKKRKAKAKAYSYLSVLGGDVVRHESWSSCESRVKGRSGARFKKASSAQNEVEILKAWGIPASKLP
jgi:ribonuclease HI